MNRNRRMVKSDGYIESVLLTISIIGLLIAGAVLLAQAFDAGLVMSVNP